MAGPAPRSARGRTSRGRGFSFAAVIALMASFLGPHPALAWDISRLTQDRDVFSTEAVVDDAGHRHILYQADGTLVYLTDAIGHWVRSVVARGVISDSDIAVSASGAAHVAFVRVISGRSVLTYSTNRSGSWVASTVEDPASAHDPAIALTSAGVPHIIWSGEGIRHARRTASGTWAIDQAWVGSASWPDLAIGPDDRLHVVWTEYPSQHVRWATDGAGSWSTGTLTSQEGLVPVIAVDAAGVSHVAYRGGDTATGVFYATDGTGSWTRQRVSQDVSNPDIEIGTGGPVLLWPAGAGDLKLARRTGTTWQTQVVIAGRGTLTDPTVGLLSDDRAVLTFREYGTSPIPGIHGAIETTAGEFPDVLIEASLGDSGAPALAVAPDGTPRMVYSRCRGAPRDDGVFIGSRSGVAWTWTQVFRGCAGATALAMDGNGHAHVAWIHGGEASYATDTSGSWITTAAPLDPQFVGWSGVAIAVDHHDRPLVALSFVVRDGGAADPRAHVWRPGEGSTSGVPAALEDATVAIDGNGDATLGGYSWAYDIDYVWRRPALARQSGSSWTTTNLASAGRGAAVAVDGHGVIHVASIRLGAPMAYVATGATFPDALVASAAATRSDGFVLLTRRSSLPSAARAELARLRPDHVLVVGGIAVVSTPVEETVGSYAFTPQRPGRFAGADRYATASAVTYGPAAWDCCGTIFITSGADFPDALSASSMVGSRDGLLLVTHGSIPAATRARLTARHIVILGGTGAISTSVETQLRHLVPGASVERIFGADRYATSAAVARRAFPNGAPVVYLATGEAFPDGLAAGPAARHDGGPLLLTRTANLPAATRAALVGLAPKRVVLVGGTGAISTAVAGAVRAALPGAALVRVAGADRYATAAALTAFAFPQGAGLYHQTLSQPSTPATLVTRLIPEGRLSLAVAADGTERIAFAGPDPGIHVARSDGAGGWTILHVTTDAQDHDPTLVVANGRTHVAFERGGSDVGSGIFLAAE